MDAAFDTGALGVSTGAASANTRGSEQGLGADAYRRAGAGKDGGQGSQALQGRRPRETDSPGNSGRVGDDPDAGAGQGLRGGQIAGCLYKAGGSAARVSALRGAVGAPLAGPDALCRQRGLQPG